MQVILPYESAQIFQHYCKMNKIKIIASEYEEKISFTIELALGEKEKVIEEIEKKQINIEKMEMIKVKNIRKEEIE